MEKKYNIIITEADLEVIYSGLLELKGKQCLPVISRIEEQIKKIIENEPKSTI